MSELTMQAVELQFRKWTDSLKKEMCDKIDLLDTKLDGLMEEFHKRCEADSAVVAHFENLKEQVDRSGDYNESVIKLSVKVDQILSELRHHSPQKMNDDLQAAHSQLRVHEDTLKDHGGRINHLEDAPGKVAVIRAEKEGDHRTNLRNMILVAAITFAGTGLFGLLIWLLGRGVSP